MPRRAAFVLAVLIALVVAAVGLRLWLARRPGAAEAFASWFEPYPAGGRRIAGRVVKGDLLPFPDRHAIDAGALAGRKLEIAWVDDPVGAFFLQVQGSGRVRLEDGQELRVGYAAQNGHPYTAIGRELVARHALAAKDVSLQTIRAWLEAHPDQAREVMERNASYVFFQFFKSTRGNGPLGAQGPPLTPGRSLAVDL